MTKEEKQERIRRKRIAAKKRKIRLRRRAYALLLIFVLILVGYIFFKAGERKSANSVSSNGMVSAGAGSAGTGSATTSDLYSSKDGTKTRLDDEGYNDIYSGVGADIISVSDNSYYNPNGALKQDVSTGTANINLLAVEESGGNVLLAAKDAMKNRAYFNGTNNTVNNILMMHAPDGEWHAIKTTDNKVCVFFEGHHDKDEFKVTFTMLNDGTFYLQNISINNELISEPIVYITEIL